MHYAYKVSVQRLSCKQSSAQKQRHQQPCQWQRHFHVSQRYLQRPLVGKSSKASISSQTTKSDFIFSNFPANPPVLGTNLCFFGVTNSNTSEREAPGNEQKLTACTQQDRDHLVIQRWISPAGTLPVAHPTVVLPSETPTALKPFQLLPVWSRLTCGSAHTPLCTPSAQSSHWHWGHTYPCGPWSYSRGWHWFSVTLVPPVSGTKAQGQS